MEFYVPFGDQTDAPTSKAIRAGLNCHLHAGPDHSGRPFREIRRSWRRQRRRTVTAGSAVGESATIGHPVQRVVSLTVLSVASYLSIYDSSERDDKRR